MIVREKYAITSILIVFLMLFQVNEAIDMMPLCQSCAADDGYSCIVCGTCQTYSVVVSGNLIINLEAIVNAILDFT